MGYVKVLFVSVCVAESTTRGSVLALVVGTVIVCPTPLINDVIVGVVNVLLVSV